MAKSKSYKLSPQNIAFGLIILVFALIGVYYFSSHFPIYEDSSDNVIGIKEINGKQFVDYRGQKNIEIVRVGGGEKCEGKISSSNSIDFCEPGFKCVKNEGSLDETPGICKCIIDSKSLYSTVIFKKCSGQPIYRTKGIESLIK